MSTTTTPPISRSPESGTRRVITRAAAGLGVLLGLGVLSYQLTETVLGDDGGAELVVVQDVPADVRAELDVTWARFTDRFEARTSCIGTVSLELVRDVEGGDARYVHRRARIEIEIPTTPARFRESVVHELAHHVEHTCPDFEQLRDELHPRWGGPDRPWTGGDVWAEIPSEMWAEAVVELVNGERIRHADEIVVDPQVVELIVAWSSTG
jgi:hypothetical protein